MKRLTADDFRNSGVRGVGFSDAHKGPVAPDGFDFVRDMGAKAIRTAFTPKLQGDVYVLPSEQIESLRVIVGEAERRGMRSILCMALPEPEHEALWASKRRMRSLVFVWELVAWLFAGRHAVAGLDFFNEPKLTQQGQDAAYWAFVAQLLAAVWSVDGAHVPIIETWPGARVDTRPEWGEFWRPQPRGVVMSGHFYTPFDLTHKNLLPWTTPGKDYHPTDTLEQMRAEASFLDSVAILNDVPVWTGEGSTLQSEPGAADWAQHWVDLHHEFGWSYSWHYVHGPTEWHPNEATQKVLRAGFSRA